MSNYGVTENGFVLKRMDVILEQVHAELSEGFGFDTRLSASSFLKVLVTTFCGQIAECWETAQDEYYAKYPSTATGVNLDNAVQYGGVRRKQKSQSLYPLHCTGDDGTVIRSDAIVASDTSPEVRLYATTEFTLTRNSCNEISIKVAVAQAGSEYMVTINGYSYSFTSEDTDVLSILNGLKDAITDDSYITTIDEFNMVLNVKDTDATRNNAISLTENLTTASVTTVGNFYTEEYGKIILPNGIVSKLINNISGFNSVTNILEPTYGRLQETDIELRQSYISRSAIRSNTMIDSIVAELLSNVAGVETASGYENVTDETDARGLPPHSIELIVEGGNSNAIADAILQKKAGGIQTYGSVLVNVSTKYGDVIPIKFNRPEYLYTWIKVVLHGDFSKMPTNYAELTKKSIVNDTSYMLAGSSLLTQLLNEGIYDAVPGITYIEIHTAYSTDRNYIPADNEYKQSNIMVSLRQKVLVDSSRIEVSIYDT